MAPSRLDDLSSGAATDKDDKILLQRGPAIVEATLENAGLLIKDGSWTPDWGGSTGAPTSSYSARHGRYQIWGPLMTVHMEMTMNGAGNTIGSGDVEINGLPTGIATPDFSVLSEIPCGTVNLSGEIISFGTNEQIGLVLFDDSGTPRFKMVTIGSNTVVTWAAMTTLNSVQLITHATIPVTVV